MVKNPPANTEDAGGTGLIPGPARSSGAGDSNSLQYSSGKFHGLRSLASHSPWVRTELDMTEHM